MLSKRANIDFCKNKMLDSPMPLTCFSHQKKKTFDYQPTLR